MLEYLKTNIFFTFAILFFVVLPVILTFSLGYKFNSNTGQLDSVLNLSVESIPLFSKIEINKQIVSEFGKIDMSLQKDSFFVATIKKDNFITETFKFISPKNQNSTIRISPVALLPSDPKQTFIINKNDTLIDNHIFSFNNESKQISYKNILQNSQLGPEIAVNIYDKVDNLPEKLKLDQLNEACYYDQKNNLVLNYKNFSNLFGVNFNSSNILNKPKKLFCLNDSIIFINQFNQLWNYSNISRQFTFLDDGINQLFVSENNTVWVVKSDALYQAQVIDDKRVNLVKIYQNLSLLNEIKEFEVLNFIQGFIVKINNKVIQIFPDYSFHIIDNQAKLVAITNRGVGIFNTSNQLVIWNLFSKQQQIVNLPDQSNIENTIIKLSYDNDLKRFFIHNLNRKNSNNGDKADNYSIDSIWLDYEQLNPLVVEYSNIKWIDNQKNCNKNLIGKIQYCQNQGVISIWNTESII